MSSACAAWPSNDSPGTNHNALLAPQANRASVGVMIEWTTLYGARSLRSIRTSTTMPVREETDISATQATLLRKRNCPLMKLWLPSIFLFLSDRSYVACSRYEQWQR